MATNSSCYLNGYPGSIYSLRLLGNRLFVLFYRCNLNIFNFYFSNNRLYS